MSDCEQIRFYIQQKFDTDLSFEDEQAVLDHLETCDQCTRYRNQIEQIIVFAQDLPLGEEFLPANYEALVARVADHLPKPALSAFDLVLNFFKKTLGLRSEGTSIMKTLEPGIQNPTPEANLPLQAQEHQTRMTNTPSVLLPDQPIPALAPAAGKITPDISILNTSIKEAAVKDSVPADSQPAQSVATARSQQSIQEKKEVVASTENDKTQKNEIVPTKSLFKRLADVLEGKFQAEQQETTVPVQPTQPTQSIKSAHLAEPTKPTVFAQSDGPTQPVLSWTTPLARTPGSATGPQPTPPSVPPSTPAAAPPATPPPSVPLSTPAAAPPATPPAVAPSAVPSTSKRAELLAGAETKLLDSLKRKLDIPAPSSPAQTSPAPPKPPASSKELLKGIGDADIEAIFTNTLGVSPEAVQAVVHKQPPPAQPAQTVVSPELTHRPFAPETQQPVSEPNVNPQEVSGEVLQETRSKTPMAADSTPAANIAVPKSKKSETRPDSLFFLDDDTMDKIFAENLGIDTGSREITPEKIKLEEAITEAPETSPMEINLPPPADIGASIPTSSNAMEQEIPDSSAMEQEIPSSSALEQEIPDSGAMEQEIPSSAMKQEIPDSSAMKQDVPTDNEEVGLPAPPTPSIEIEGLGRLDKHAEAAEGGPSQIGAIGKFLLDKQDIANLEKLTQSNLADSGLRVLTPDAARDLQSLLDRISVVQGVVGSVIVGHDGIVVSSDLPNNIDSESIAVWSLGIYLNATNAIKKMGRNTVKQLIVQSTEGHLTIIDFGAGILTTITSDAKRKTLVSVMHVINELVSTS